MRRSATPLAMGAGLVSALALTLTLAGCVPVGATSPSGASSDSTSGSSSQPEPVATPSAAPTLNPLATATDTLAYFDAVNRASLAKKGKATGAVMIDGLVNSGFDKALMQVTADTTAIGLDADSVQFSVVWAGECLIGQVIGNAYASTVQPQLAGGSCLVGTTRPIDW